MMKHAVTLASMVLFCVLTAQAVHAQDIRFNGSDVMLLAKSITDVASKTNQLPASYTLPMANGHTMVVTSANAYELLVRAIIAWKAEKAFPQQISLQILDLTGPSPDPRYEPEMDGVKVPVFSEDIGSYAPALLAMAMAPGHKLPIVMKFGKTTATSYRLNAAQIVLAMAVLISDTVRENKFPLAIAVPLVHSPKDWADTRTPLQVGPATGGQENPVPQMMDPSLRVALQGVELAERGPIGPGGKVVPFCGVIRLEITGYGPVNKVRVLIDGIEKKVLEGPGLHLYEINTLQMSDGPHVLAVTMTSDDQKSTAYIFSFTIANGRESGFNPAEPEKANVQAEPMWLQAMAK